MTDASAEPPILRLLAAGTGHFEALQREDLPLVGEEIDQLATTFNSLGYQRIHSERSRDPSADELKKLLSQSGKDHPGAELLVVYYTSHGQRDPRENRYYLLTRDSSRDALFNTALAAEDFIRAVVLQKKAGQLLVIFDTCDSAAGAIEAAGIIADMNKAKMPGADVFIIASARAGQDAGQRALVTALGLALSNRDKRLGGHTQRYLAIDSIIDDANQYLQRHHAPQEARYSVPDGRQCHLFPNPLYRPDIHAGLDLEQHRALIEHWIPKAMATDVGGGGWYFTGRERVLRDLVAWLSAPVSDGRVRVVTGRAGTGKSSILARIVTLSNSEYRREILSQNQVRPLPAATLPPDGIVAVALHARRKTLTAMVAEMARALRSNAGNQDELLDFIAARNGKVVIVIDALDEADGRDDINLRLLRPLTELTNVFLLLGARPDSIDTSRRFRWLGRAVELIDLDLDENLGPDDVAHYVEDRLLAIHEPARKTLYRGHPDVARLVAKAVAERAGKIFLVAQIAVRSLLARGEVVDPADTAWVASLPVGVDEAMRDFLRQIEVTTHKRLTANKVRGALLPLAYATGEGLPWEGLWPKLADGFVAGVSDEDISLVQQHAAAFIIESTAHGRSVYRLYHERLVEFMRKQVAAEDAQRVMTRGLLASVPLLPDRETRDWSRAHPYVLDHLVVHARGAGSLGELLRDPMYLLAANPDSLLPQLPLLREPEFAAIARAYRAASAELKAQQSPDGAAYLAKKLLDEGQVSMTDMLRRKATMPRWMPLWSAARREAVASHAIARPPRDKHSRIEVHASGHAGRSTPLLAIGRECGRIEVWDVNDDRCIAEWTSDESIRQLALAVSSAGVLLVVLWQGSSGVGVFDLGTRQLRRIELPSERQAKALCIGRRNGQLICAVADSQRGLALYSLPELELLLARESATCAQVYDLAAVSLAGEDFIVSGSDSLLESDIPKDAAKLMLWRTSDLQTVWRDSPADSGLINRVEPGFFFGREVLVTSSYWGAPEIWDLEARRLLFRYHKKASRGWLHRHGDKTLLLTVDGEEMDVDELVVAGEGAALTLRPASIARHVRIKGHELGDIVNIRGRPCLLSRDGDQIRVLDVQDIIEAGPARTGAQAEFDCLAERPDGGCVYAGTFAGDVYRLNAVTGERSVICHLGGGITALAAYVLDGRTLLAVADHSQTISIVPDEANAKVLASFDPGGWVRTLALEMWNSQLTVLVATGVNSVWAVRLWKATNGEEIPTRVRKWRGEQWRYQLHDGMEDKPIGSLVAAARGEHLRLAFASKYGQVMVAMFGLDEKVNYGDDFDTWRLPQETGEYISAMARFDHEGRTLLAAASDRGNMVVWDFDTGEVLSSRQHGIAVRQLTVARSEHGALLVSCDSDERVRYWTLGLEPVHEIRIGERIKAIAAGREGCLVVATEGGLTGLYMDVAKLLASE